MLSFCFSSLTGKTRLACYVLFWITSDGFSDAVVGSRMLEYSQCHCKRAVRPNFAKVKAGTCKTMTMYHCLMDFRLMDFGNALIDSMFIQLR